MSAVSGAGEVLVLLCSSTRHYPNNIPAGHIHSLRRTHASLPSLRIRSCAPVAAMPPSRVQPRLATWPATLAILLLGAALASAAAAQVNQNDRKTLEGKVIIIG